MRFAPPRSASEVVPRAGRLLKLRPVQLGPLKPRSTKWSPEVRPPSDRRSEAAPRTRLAFGSCASPKEAP